MDRRDRERMSDLLRWPCANLMLLRGAEKFHSEVANGVDLQVTSHPADLCGFGQAVWYLRVSVSSLAWWDENTSPCCMRLWWGLELVHVCTAHSKLYPDICSLLLLDTERPGSCFPRLLLRSKPLLPLTGDITQPLTYPLTSALDVLLCHLISGTEEPVNETLKSPPLWPLQVVTATFRLPPLSLFLPCLTSFLSLVIPLIGSLHRVPDHPLFNLTNILYLSNPRDPLKVANRSITLWSFPKDWTQMLCSASNF